ncbi:hypothetical protein PTKIN_Ptkin18bG0091600 [Pterospermum kingtungense]
MGIILNGLIIISAMYQIIVIHFSPGICSANKVSAFFVFGDSLVDAGNNFYIDTIAKPTWPNGIDFKESRPSGRYTNARTVADIIEEEISFRNYSPPYLSPKTTGDVILKGVNYASSGSGIFNSTGSIYGERICMDEQVRYFANTRQQIISRIGTAAARKLLGQAIYFVAIGNNDVFTRVHNYSLDDNICFLDSAISKFRSQLTALYRMDARKIAVMNAAPIGSIFVYGDAYAALDNVLQNYKSYGFENANSACCRVAGKHGGKFPCVFFARVCRDRTKYLFWDAYHTSENANLIIAKHFLDGDSRYVSPMNIRQLASS